MFLGVRHKLWFLGLLLITASNSFADIEHFFNSISGKHFAKDSSVFVKDDKFLTPLWSSIQKNLSATDVVTLQMNEDTSLYLSTPENCTVDIEVTYYNQYDVADSFATSLSINFDTNRAKPFNYRTSLKFSGGYSIKTRVLAVYYGGVLSTSYPKVFTLAEDIYVNRVYKFNCDSIIEMNGYSYDATNQQLDLSWAPFLGADNYDLEFTYYDHLSQLITHNFSSPSYSDLGFLFQGNATRVTLNDFSYAISLVYDTGYIFYRVRPIHYDTLGNRIEGAWSSDWALAPRLSSTTLSSDPDMFGWKGHEPALNWQYTAAYAEDGKRKEVASYFDGTLRNRQSVTINNTESKAIVGETMYDHQGREAVTTLPAPIDSGKLVFYDKFNVNTTGKEYSRWDFDTGACGFIPPGMDSVLSGNGRGSSGYYSSSNPDVNTGFNPYLPDAQGYPFTETEYTPDNTGRISSQSIAGKTHTLGSNHETKYFYGNPSQEQLDRLFGSEVGANSHYLENMVIDANGQISVSYVDANGKTVATALAGQVPLNLSPLPSYYPADTLTINLLGGPGNINNHPPSIYNTYGLLATNQGKYFFSYKLLPDDYTDSTCISSLICSDCLYDVTLMVTDGCGADPPLIIKHDTNFTYASAHPFDTTCHNQNITDTFSLYLYPGNYNITRVITVDNGAINYYTNRFLATAPCLQNYTDFYNNALANTDFTGCGMDCQTCLASIGADTTFIRKYMGKIIGGGGTPKHSDSVAADSIYASALAQCNILCQPPNECTPLYNQMLADMSLGGQYCKYDTLHGKDTATSEITVLNPLATYISNYKTPVPYYVNSNNVRDTVIINGHKYLPQNLNINDFIQNWNPSWAQALVAYHPEYCYYKYCELDTASNRYDYEMENTNSFALALSAGFLNPLGDGTEPYTINWNDPYFAVGGLGNSMLTWMKTHTENWVTVLDSNSRDTTLSLWSAAALALNSQIDTLSGHRITWAIPPFGGGCPGNNNMEWDFFRGVYMSMKQHIQDSLENVYVASAGCSRYAACVGQLVSPCTGTPYDGMQPRHYTLANMNIDSCEPSPINPATEREYFHEHLISECDTQCRSYAYSWYQSLRGCGAISSPDSIALIAGLELVCETGCNATHPVGSSNTPDLIPDGLGDKDFEDVIVRVLGAARADTSCDSLNITMPLPYIDSNGVAGAPITYYKPSTCICNKLDSLLTHYYKPDSLSHDPRYINFADYLNKNFGGNLSDSIVYSLMDLCDDTDCFFAQYPTQLPMWLTCCSDTTINHTFNVYNSLHVLTWDTTVGITQGCCIKCADIDAGMRIFEKELPGADTAHNYQNLLANFLNNLYGFNLNYPQYIAFHDSCAEIHCTVSYDTTYAFVGRCGVASFVYDSMCGDITIIDTVPGYNCTRWSRTIIGPYKRDSLAPTLCNSPLNTPPPIPPSDTNPCLTQLLDDATYNATNAYNNYLDSLTLAFQNNYVKHCMMIDDSFHLRMPFDEYHYTLYYYDQAENLVKTIPPQGVHPITSISSLDSITNYREGLEPKPVYPRDSLASRYWYNTLNSPIKQQTPDGDSVHFWYDRLGRIALSQNAIQRNLSYSYTQYDALGRIIEVGQVSTVPQNLPSCFHCVSCIILYGVLPVLPDTFARNDAELQNFINTGTKTQITQTFYDSVAFKNIPLTQNNLRKRISGITYKDYNINPDSAINKYFNAIHYSYDIEGNVSSILIDVPHDSMVHQRYKRLDYYYDLVSGKVNEIVYQHDSIDQFMQSYEYDADNRITDVLTSADSINWTEEANYQYYPHGPLAREVIGRRQVQGLDYAYTLNGWIKGMNSSMANTTTSPSHDMGHDGDVHDANATVGRYAVGYTLNYFNGDYRAIGGTSFAATGLPTTDLFNGNISGATYSIAKLKPKTIGYKYNYDQLNRITQMQAYSGIDTALIAWASADTISSFREKVSYDENGNILTYLRHGNTNLGHLAMDSMNYYYNKNTNQLNHIADAVPSGNYPNDLDNEPRNNYRYNAIGERAKDSINGIDTIIWTVYGKVKKIVKYSGDSIVYEYDPLGNKLEERYYHGSASDTTKYSRDAQGNILAVYNRKRDTVRLKEWDIYGSTRIGEVDTVLRMQKPKVGYGPMDSLRIAYLEGQRQYELTNHLGNVLATVDDRKLPIDTTITPNVANYYLANILNAQDYYVYGGLQPGRTYFLANYEFGFNGKLKDDSIFGKGNFYDYGMRVYDWTSQFWSIDPITKQFPELSPYQYASDRPIEGNDLDGKEFEAYTVVSWMTDIIVMKANTQQALSDYVQGSTGTAEYNNAQVPEDVQKMGNQQQAVHGATVLAQTETTVLLNGASVYLWFIDPEAGLVEDLAEEACLSKFATNEADAKIVPADGATLRPGDYSNLEDSKFVGPEKDYTRAQKKTIINENKRRNGGVIVDDYDGQKLDKAVQSKKGIKANMNQAEVHHHEPKSLGGSNSYKNARVTSKRNNLKKGNKPPDKTN